MTGGIILATAKDGVTNFRRTVITDNVLHQSLEAAIFCGHALYAHDSYLLHLEFDSESGYI